MTIPPYLDPALSARDRAADLVARMSLEQKVGLLFHDIVPAATLDTPNPVFGGATAREMLDRGMTHFNLLGSFGTVDEFVHFFNAVQDVALAKPLGIPVTFSSDPRHAFTENLAMSMKAGVLSKWPEHIGMAAIGDPERMRQYADIVRQEYVALGIRAALHPQVDLATEYRWSRLAGGLGESAQVASELCVAHVRGLQGDSLGPDSVAACVKHFPGGGPTRGGLDPHFSWGSDQIYPGGRFDYHLQPFRDVVATRPGSMMLSYGKPVGTKYEPVAMAFNRGIAHDLLRDELGFDGVVLADWGVLTDYDDASLGDIAKARAWGVETLSRKERMLRALDAGVDQFGGEQCPDVALELVREGLVSEARIDQSALRLIQAKVELGLFENPYASVDRALAVVGADEFVRAGRRAQKDALTLVSNERDVLPLRKGAKVYAEGVDIGPGYAAAAPSADDADVVVVRLATPFEPVGAGMFASWFHHGALDFSADTVGHIADLARRCPNVVLVVDADRPPVLTPLLPHVSAVVLAFGVEVGPLCEVLFGDDEPGGKLPFDLPRSTAAVAASRADVPFDTADPCFRFGHGLRYKSAL